MIHGTTKQKLLKELEKSGNVFVACLKSNIGRTTYYRWRTEDATFQKQSDMAIQHGRENNCDIGEHALMQKVKEKDMPAIKYLLGHMSPRYRQKNTTKVILEHLSSKVVDNALRSREIALIEEQTKQLRKLMEGVETKALEDQSPSGAENA